jgi:hypothetical protein
VLCRSCFQKQQVKPAIPGPPPAAAVSSN